MADSLVSRLRAVAFVLAAVGAAVLIGLLVVDPTTVTGAQPFPLIVLLALAMLIALWQTWRLSRG